MKKLVLGFFLLLSTQVFAIPQTPPCEGDCTLTRTAEFEIDTLRGGVHHDLYVCGVALNHECDECKDDYLHVLNQAGQKIHEIVGNGVKEFTTFDNPKKIVLFLNSLRKGAGFSLRFCSDVRRVVVGDKWTKAAATLHPTIRVTAGHNQFGGLEIFENGLHIDRLKYNVQRRCDNNGVLGAWVTSSTLDVKPGQFSFGEFHHTIPYLVKVDEGRGWKCLKGRCQFQVNFKEFDKCFRFLDENCRGDVECRAKRLRLKVDARVRADFHCLADCD